MKTIKELIATANLRILHVGVDGGCGELWQAGKAFATVIWSTGGGWEHVSIAPYKHSRTPTWDEMCRLKDMFFRDNEVVVQYHPKKSDYVNNVSNCLHLWRPLVATLPVPPSIMVGIRYGQTIAEVAKEIEALGGE